MNVFNYFFKTCILILAFITVLEARNSKRQFKNSSAQFKSLTQQRVFFTTNTTEPVHTFHDRVFLVATHRHPWVASLQKENFNRGNLVWRHKCTTSILNEFWTVTACHCVAYRSDGGGLLKSYYPGDHRVVAGTTRLGGKVTEHVKIRQIDMFTHSTHCWKDNTYQSNYGGVKLKEKLSFTPFISPLEYASVDRKRITTVLHKLQRNKSTCHVVGWGLTYLNGTDLLTMKSHVSVNQYVISVKLKSDHFCDNMLCKRHPIYCESGRSQIRNELCALPLKSEEFLPTSGSCLVCGRYSFGFLSWVYGSDFDSPPIYFFSRFDKPFNFSHTYKIRNNSLRIRSNGLMPRITYNVFNLIFVYWVIISLAINM